MYKALDLWLPSYLFRRRQRSHDGGTTDIMFALCDHFEPFNGASGKEEAMQRMLRWKQTFPKLIEPYPDSDKVRPRHTFFFPVEQYDKEIVQELAELSSLCRGEVELHLHHERDTAETLREKLETGKAALARHGFLARDKAGAIRYAFIHGNWALDDSHPEHQHCGVPIELRVLKETGCYADFTMPSAPDPTQTRIINSIYYAQDTPAPKSHDTGIPARAQGNGTTESHRGNELLLVQGPLGLNWECRKFGFLPRIENSAITGKNPPRPDRMRLWMRLGIHVEAQPNWVFIKLHTHGGVPRNMITLLEDPMRRFYDYLLANYNDGKNYRLHFVTAREMVNIIHAAEDGKTGNAGQFRDYRFVTAAQDTKGTTQGQ
jgi:hypothetical protein